MPSLNYTITGTLILHSTIFRLFDNVKALGSQRIFQSDTTQLLPCLSGLFPLSDLWYSWLIAVTSAVYVWTLRLTHALSCAWTTSKLCRWLAGVYQRITAPLFYLVNYNSHLILSSLIVTGPLYHNWVRMSSVYIIFYSFISLLLLSVGCITYHYITLSWFVKRVSERWCP